MDKLMHFSRDRSEVPLPARPFSRPAVPPRAMVSIESLISPRHSRIIIRKVFDNNMADYTAFVRNLNAQPDWASAFNKLDAEFTRRHVLPTCDAAILFSNIVYLRYFTGDDELAVE